MVAFGVIGLAHPHISRMIDLVRAQGGELKAIARFESGIDTTEISSLNPSAEMRKFEDIISDPDIELVLCAARPRMRSLHVAASLGAGKAVFCAKPAAIKMSDVVDIRAAYNSSGAAFRVFFSEVLDCVATQTALSLVQAGKVGEVVQVIGAGPHKLSAKPRPDWFFDRHENGGILADLGSHQAYQFLSFSGQDRVGVSAAWTALLPQQFGAGFDVAGEVSFEAQGTRGHSRVDWLLPRSFPRWGDTRLSILAEFGRIEVFKNGDPSGVRHDPSVLLMLSDEIRSIDMVPLRNLASEVLREVRRPSERGALNAQRDILATELAVRAQELADFNHSQLNAKDALHVQ